MLVATGTGKSILLDEERGGNGSVRVRYFWGSKNAIAKPARAERGSMNIKKAL